MQGAARILDGQWPYADFGWPYGPGQPVAVAGLSWLFEPSVAWWRRAAGGRRRDRGAWRCGRWCGRRRATAGRSRRWLAAAVTVAQPTSANPFPVALAFALCAVLAAARGRPVPAGLLVALGGVLAARHRRRGRAWRRVAALLPRGRRRRARRRCHARAASRAGAGSVRAALAGGGGRRGSGARCTRRSRSRRASRRLWDELVGIAAGDGELWRLPFPLGYDGPLRGWPPSRAGRGPQGRARLLPAARAASRSACSCWSRSSRRRPAPELAGVTVLAAAARCTCSRAPTTCTPSRWSCACARAVAARRRGRARARRARRCARRSPPGSR